MIFLGNYNVASIIQNEWLYKSSKSVTDSDDSDIDDNTNETEQSNEDIKVDDVNKRDAHKRTPLHLAVLNGDVNLVKKLLERNADVNLVDDVGSNPLHRAAENGNFFIYRKIDDHSFEYKIESHYFCMQVMKKLLNC